MRKGLGKGKGMGYKNLIIKDKVVHSQSAKGIKQPEKLGSAMSMSKFETEKKKEKELTDRQLEIKERLDEIKERYEILENNYNTDEYDEMLDDVGIDTSMYSGSDILKNVDETAYRVGMNDYNDEEMSELESERQDLEDELEGLDDEYREEEIKERLAEIKERYEILENNDNTDEYDDMLDDVGIDTSVYSPSQILKNVDETAYRVGMSDYYDSEMSELESEKQDLEEEFKSEN